VTWVEESDETRTEVASLFAEKKYLDAVKVLDSAMHGSLSSTDEQEYRYLMAAAWYGAGQSARSYRALSDVSADPSAQWYAKYVLLKAQVLVDATDFSGALDVLKPFISAYPSGEPAQVAWLLSSYCSRGLGDTPAAKAALDTGYKLDPSSETAQLIDQERKTRE
jgi:tetratricopeptide (TPR) repeat protein